jgi:hypothetical protein
MSAFFSLRYRDRVCILSDAAWLDGEMNLVAIASKIHIIPKLPIALSARSSSIEGLAKILNALDVIESPTVNEWIRDARQCVRSLTRDGGEHEIIVAAWSESRGPLHFALVTHDRWAAAGIPAHRLTEVEARDFGAGADITAADLAGLDRQRQLAGLPPAARRGPVRNLAPQANTVGR